MNVPRNAAIELLSFNWNSLPADVVMNAPSVDAFKGRLDRFCSGRLMRSDSTTRLSLNSELSHRLLVTNYDLDTHRPLWLSSSSRLRLRFCSLWGISTVGFSGQGRAIEKKLLN